MHITQGMACTQQVANDMAGILSRDMACVKLEACFGSCVACVNFAYGAICRCILHKLKGISKFSVSTNGA